MHIYRILIVNKVNTIVLLMGLQLLFGAKGIAQEYKVYKTDGISIEYPVDWEVSSHLSAKFIFLRPIEEEGQQFKENINLVVGDAKGLKLGEYLIACKSQLAKVLNGYKDISTEFMILNNEEFCRVVYRYNVNGLSLKVALFISIHNGKAYQFTCSSLETTYEKYLPTFMKMMNSCRIS